MHANDTGAAIARGGGGYNATGADGGDVETAAEAFGAGPRWWPLFLGSFVFCTLFGNALVVASVVKYKRLRSVTNYFIVSLAVADVAVGALVMPLAVYVEVMEGRFALPEELCDAWIAADVMASTASILNLVAISIDRFMAITHPLKYQHSIKNSVVYTASTIAACWLVSIAIALPLALGANYTSYRVQNECSFANPLFIIFSSMGSFFIPSCIMIIVYWKIFKVIRERAATAKEKNRDRKRVLSRALSVSDGSPAVTASSAVGMGGGGGCNYAEEAAAIGGGRDDNSNGSGSGVGACAVGQQTSVVNHPAATPTVAATENSAGGSATFDDVWIRRSSSNRVLPDDMAAQQSQRLLPSTNGTANGTHCDTAAAAKTAAAKTAATSAPAKPAGSGKKAAGDSRRKDKKERKATITLVVVLGVFLFCWIPFFILNNLTAVCLVLYGDARVCSIPPWLMSCFVWLGYCNSTVNPLIYAVLNNDFRRAFLKLLRPGDAKRKGARGRIK